MTCTIVRKTVSAFTIEYSGTSTIEYKWHVHVTLIIVVGACTTENTDRFMCTLTCKCTNLSGTAYHIQMCTVACTCTIECSDMYINH